MSLPKEVKEGWDVLPSTEDTSMRSKIEVGKTFIAHKFDDWMSPWDIGKVVPPTKRWKQKPGDPPPDEFYVKYPSENVFYPHELKDAEYGEEKTWVIVRKAQHVAKAPLGKSSHKPGTTQPPPPASAGAADPAGLPAKGRLLFATPVGGDLTCPVQQSVLLTNHPPFQRTSLCVRALPGRCCGTVDDGDSLPEAAATQCHLQQ